MALTKLQLKQLVTFVILMENREGITSKAPSYLEEKYNSCLNGDSDYSLLGLLDSHNASKYRNYMKLWRIT